jgi:hypothetical protein
MRFIIIFFPILFGTTVASEGMFSWLFSSGEEITAEELNWLISAN